MLPAGEPCLPALLLAVGPGFQAVLLGSGQVWSHILVSVEHQVLQRAPDKIAGSAAVSCTVAATFAAHWTSGVAAYKVIGTSQNLAQRPAQSLQTSKLDSHTQIKTNQYNKLYHAHYHFAKYFCTVASDKH